MQDLNILLIEDNPADAFLIREMLNPGGSQDFRISHAGNLKESFKLIKEKRFDFIISDLGLPDSYGLDTVKSVIAKINHLPIVVLTGYNNEQMGNDALSIGAQDYLVKGTINAEQLHRSIRYAFRRKKSETELRASEVKFRTMVETSPDGVVTLNLDGAILYASKRALEEHGYLKENNLAGKKFWDLFSENDKLKVIKRFRDIEKIGVISNEEYLMIREDNSQFYGELSASLVKNEMGNANGYIVVTKDISQRKKNENAIIKYQNQDI